MAQTESIMTNEELEAIVQKGKEARQIIDKRREDEVSRLCQEREVAYNRADLDAMEAYAEFLRENDTMTVITNVEDKTLIAFSETFEANTIAVNIYGLDPEEDHQFEWKSHYFVRQNDFKGLYAKISRSANRV